MRNRLLIGVATLVVLLAAAYFAVSYVLYGQLATIAGACADYQSYRPDRFADPGGSWGDFDFSPYFVSQFESVRFPSREAGIEISGWYMEADPAAPAVIVVHGLGGCKATPSVLVPAGMLWNGGFNVLAIDVRDAGQSTFEDGRTAIGNEEYLDALGAWDWLVAEKRIPPARIGLLGNSLGGATVFIAFAQEPRVAAVFVDSPFDNLPQIIREELERNNYPLFLTPGGLWMARLLSGDNLTEHNPYEAIESAGSRPIFVVHGTADTRISVQHSLQLQDRAQAQGANAEFWIPEGVEHIQASQVRTTEYEQRLLGFFRMALGD